MVVLKSEGPLPPGPLYRHHCINGVMFIIHNVAVNGIFARYSHLMLITELLLIIPHIICGRKMDKRQPGFIASMVGVRLKQPTQAINYSS